METNKTTTEDVKPVAEPAGDQMSLTQLAEGIALERRQRTQAEAPEPTDQPKAEQAADQAEPKPENQLPPAEEGADPNALWNQVPEPTDGGAEQDAEGGEAGQPQAGEGDAAAGADGATAAEAPPGTRKLQKRVDKLTAELRSTQEQLRAANELLNGKAAETAAAPPVQVLSLNPEVKRIEGELSRWNTVLDWCRENPEGGEFASGDKKQFFDADAVRRIRDKVELTRTELLSERGAVLTDLRRQDAAARQQFEAVYAAAYGDLEHGTTAEAREYREILKQAPWVLQYPNGKLWVADAIRGRIAREAAMRKAQAPSPRSRLTPGEPAPVATLPVAAQPPPEIEPGKRQMREAVERFSKSGSVDDLARAIAARRAAERTR